MLYLSLGCPWFFVSAKKVFECLKQDQACYSCMQYHVLEYITWTNIMQFAVLAIHVSAMREGS